MSRIAALTPATAQGAAQDMLSELVARHAQVRSMVSTMANSPAVLGGYLQLSKAMKRAKLVAAREGTSPDPAVAAMIALGLAIYSNPTTVTDDQVAELHAFGYTDRELVDAVGIVALNVLTGWFCPPLALPSERTTT